MKKTREYKQAIKWIAENDQPFRLDPTPIKGQPSVQVLAIAFGLSALDVAVDVVEQREI